MLLSKHHMVFYAPFLAFCTPDCLHDTYTSKMLETFLADRHPLGGGWIEIAHGMLMLLVDAGVGRLWADIKCDMYKEFNSNQATGHGNGDVYHKKDIGKSEQ